MERSCRRIHVHPGETLHHPSLRPHPYCVRQLHLPALAMESCWPSLFATVFSIHVAPYQMREARWATLLATLVCLLLNLAFLAVGAEKRRGLMPLLLALCGSGLVLVSPVYFLAGEVGYLGPEWETTGRSTVHPLSCLSWSLLVSQCMARSVWMCVLLSLVAGLPSLV